MNTENRTSGGGELPEHVLENRGYWDAMADEWVESGERNWAQDKPTWGIWNVSEEELRLLPAKMDGMDAVELGCGTAYVSAWMARRGARVVGIDNSAEQLATARRLASEHGVSLELIHGSAEETGFASAAFDFAISEYGAAIWCDPYRWVAEAHRILRPGGSLVFLGHHPLVMACTPESGEADDRTLHRSWFDMHMLDWRGAEIDPGGVEFNLPTSAWFRLFNGVGFDVVGYDEPRPPEQVDGERFSIAADWARAWPSEQVWKLRKRTVETA